MRIGPAGAGREGITFVLRDAGLGDLR